MVKTGKATGRAMSIPGGLAVGAAISLGLTLLLALLIAKLVDAETLPHSSIGYCVLVLLLVASFSGAAAAQGRVKHRRAMVCMLSGLVYMLLLLSMTALFFGGQYTGVGVTALLVFAGAGCAALTSAQPGRRGGVRRKRKY